MHSLFGILCDKHSDNLSGILSGIHADILSDIYPDILSGILYLTYIHPDILSGIIQAIYLTYILTFYEALCKLHGILCDIHSAIVSGIFSDIHSGILSGILYLALEVQRFSLSSGGFRSVYDSDV